MRTFSIKRAIIILTLVLIYSAAFCMVKICAEKAILEDVTPPSNLPAVNLDNTQTNTDKIVESAEKISDKIEMDGYDIFTPEATKVSEVTTVSTSETAPESVTTTPPTTSEEPTTAPTTEATTSPSVTTVPTTEEEEKTTTVEEEEEDVTTTPEDDEEDVVDSSDEDEIVEDEDEEILEDDTDEDDVVLEEDDVILEDPDVTLSPEDEYDNWLVSSILQGIADGSIVIPDSSQIETPGYYPEDNLFSGDSYRNETITIYNKKTGRYVTGNAFDIICGITFNEVGTSMDKEAIKAQAVAAYTYIKYYEAKGEIASISMKTDVPQMVIDAVSEIDGLAMYYDNEYIMAAFSASTGGYTASSENVWGGVRPYLKSVKNDYDYLDGKHYGRVTTYTVEEVRNAIESNTNIKLSNNYSEWIKIVSHVDTVYAGQISIDGHTSAFVSGKERKISGYVFRSYILGIRSTNFTVSYNDGVFTFVTYGYGHGVGMSQIGANLYATYGGYTFDQILHHYYTGITIR